MARSGRGSVKNNSRSEVSAPTVRIAATLKLSRPPQFLDSDRRTISGLRMKDVALLTFLWLSGVRRHNRPSLARMLWANVNNAKARHSLTQALRRIQRVTAPESIAVSALEVEWKRPSPGILDLLESAGYSLESLSDAGSEALSLDGFFAGEGAALFEAWCEQRCAVFKHQLVHQCKLAARAAEAKGDLESSVKLAESGLTLDPFDEEAHRRIMLLSSALGQKSRALLHYRKLEAFLKAEIGETPDPQTTELANRIRSNALSHPSAESVP